ncbi:beta strand repeat-containing protein [Deinococcus altitudinis]|uniref:beta strand repeat-containing protein n=1 Tax=Deinococcus altitudinis TaxID=468914 RepID=UPI0038920C09
MLTKRALPLLTALLLAACGQQGPVASTPNPATTPTTDQPVATQPVITLPVTGQPITGQPVATQPQALGHIYEVRFQDIGGQHPTSSTVQVANPAALGTQALRDVDGKKLDFALLSVDTFLSGGTRHVRAIYKVTNNTGANLEHLTFVPINTDEDSDPATPTQTTPTVGATYFKDLSTFGNTDASGRAADLTPTTGRIFSAAQGAALTDPEATPYAALDTAPLNPAAPAGLVVAGRSGSGWRSGTALASGASTNVTFAVDIANSAPTTDPFAFSVVVTEADDANTAPKIVPAASTTQRLSLAASPATVGGVLSDPTDPASVNGLDFTVSDAETAASALSVSVTSSDPSVATAAVTGSGATRTVRITPVSVGKANVVVSVTDGTLTTSYTVNYAASKASGTPADTRFLTGISNASSAIAIDSDTMVVADDEYNALKVYSRSQSGLPFSSFDFSSNLSLTDAANPELDLEASTRVGNRLYWLASHSNSKNGKIRPNRYRLFATDLSGAGTASTLSFAGSYGNLRSDLLAWDSGNGHGLGANYLGLTASTADGVAPEAAGGVGFNIEGLSMAPGSSTTAFLGFRAPTEPTGSRSKALIVPVINFTSLVTGAAQATFGAPILLDLGGRGIRELKCNDTSCLILAGPATDGKNFALYTWSGNPADPAQLRNDLSALATESDGSLESIVEVPTASLTTAADGASIPLLSDNGDTVYYGDGAIAKDVTLNWQKFRSDKVALAPAQVCTVNSVSVSPSTASVNIGASTAFTATVTTTPASCPVVVTYASIDTSKATVNASTGVATGVAAGTSSIVATASAGYGSAPVSSGAASGVLTVNGAADFTLTLGTPSSSSFTAGTGGTATASLTLNPVNGYSGTPTYTVNSLPAGVTGSVSGGAGNLTANLNVPANLGMGNYTVTVTGTDGSLTRTSNQKALTVSPAATVIPNVTVYQVGAEGGTTALTNVATAVFLKTFKGDTGAPVGMPIALPTAASGSNKPLTSSGSASSEGLLSTSADGRYLVLTGYGATPGTAGVASTATTAVPRVIGRVDASGTVDTSTSTTAFSGNNIRSAASTDGSSFYATGGNSGVQLVGLGSTTSTAVSASTATVNLRQVGISGNQLYTSAGSGTTVRLATVGSGTPTTGNQPLSNLSGIPLTGSPYAFFFADLDGTPGIDTVYVADDGPATATPAGGIQKYVLSGGTWTAKGTAGVAADGYRGLTGVVNGSSVNLYATTTSKLVSLIDSSGYNGTLSGTPTTLATAPMNTAFRGVALSPR